MNIHNQKKPDYSPVLDERNKRLLKLISPRKNQRILVIGTGVFPKIEYFLYKNYGCKEIIGTDIDIRNLNNAKKYLQELSFDFLDAQKKFIFPSVIV